jgi:peptidyl-prolyl cis-trans isomerase B (cyclophilin B)
VLVPALGVLGLAGCGGSSPPTATTSSTAATTTTTAAAGASGCTTVPRPKMGARSESAPTALLPASAHYSITFDTNCGDFTIVITQASAPHAAASFVALTQKGYFNDTIFDRIVPGFVIQGGDPTGTQTGGPGYTTVDNPASDSQYTEGVVAMAKTEDQVPGTAGSQFVIVTEAVAAEPPLYAIVGHVTSGLEVVEAIGKLGSDQTQLPTRVVEIEKATVSTGG